MESTLRLDPDAAPPLRPLLAGTLFAVLVCVLAGPFGTHMLAAPSRLVFWLVLIGWNSLKWWLWYGWAGARAGGLKAALLVAAAGSVLLNATVPLEVDMMFRAIGQPIALSWSSLYLTALAIAAGIAMLIAVLTGPEPAAATPVPAPEPSLPAVPSRLAARAGLADLAGVQAVTAEDHYLRLHLADGRRPLVLFRFGDALAELAARDGCQVHRGAWVAAGAVAGARREGRRWRLLLADGSDLPVSPSHLAAVRARGWLSPRRV